ncbi:PLAC8-domain-containing protein [Lophiostoma macrostomum CBS 122681]|uniref:PLAC8-domain-containing protein n=1 Tax=Lophiostoma macrostomum CBS 122681 TaxID=1314788 RepID=A0A6A6SXH7_9PLEO|nr:PLAC8-domain-containing protein [Lophiostoma macrostomum CBS 122681]
MSQNQEQEWHYSGSDCCSPFSTCFLSWCCPCFVYGKTHYRMKNQGNMNGYSSFNGACAASCALTTCGFGFVLPWINRSEMRSKYGLKGSGCTDCLCACCCTPCDITQQDKEAEYREKQPFMQQPGKEHMAYQQQQFQPQPQQFQTQLHQH